MEKRVMKYTSAFVAVLAVFMLPLAVTAQPATRPVIQATDIDKEMAPCTELIVGAEGERGLPRSAIESCGGQCENMTRQIVTGVREYFRTALRARIATTLIAGIAGGVGLWLVVLWSERLRRIGGGDIFLLATSGMIVIGAFAMIIPYFVERTAAERFIAADHDLRGLSRLGLIGRASLATNVHCTTQLAMLLGYSDSPVWRQLGTYPGLFTDFDTKVKLIPGDATATTELGVRLVDIQRVLDGYIIPPQPLPTSVNGVFRTNEMLRAVAKAWDRYGFLRWRIVGGVVAAFLGLLIHYLCRFTHDAFAKARVRQMIAGAAR